MSIILHIERLVLDGVDVAPGRRHVLQAAVETELTRLLSEGGLAEHLASGGAVPRVAGAPMSLERGAPDTLGRQVAHAVYGGIGK